MQFWPWAGTSSCWYFKTSIQFTNLLTNLNRYAVDQGWVAAKEPVTIVKIQCPCGLVPAYVSVENGVAGSVRFQSVPCFVFAKS